MITHKQLSLEDIFTDCQNIFENDKPEFLSLLEQHINLDEFVPASFHYHFHAWTGRPCKYSLFAFLRVLIIQKIFTIPTDGLLLTFLHYSKPLRDFCGFDKDPDASRITRFKQDFLPDLQSVFNRLVDITEPICQAIDVAKADRSIFDSSGIEAWVKENNPKYAGRIIRQLKTYAKAMDFDKSYDPFTALCPPALRQITKSNNSTSTGIFAMSTNSVLSQTDWASFVILPFTIKTSLRRILKLKPGRSLILRMKTSPYMIQDC